MLWFSPADVLFFSPPIFLSHNKLPPVHKRTITLSDETVYMHHNFSNFIEPFRDSNLVF